MSKQFDRELERLVPHQIQHNVQMAAKAIAAADTIFIIAGAVNRHGKFS